MKPSRFVVSFVVPAAVSLLVSAGPLPAQDAPDSAADDQLTLQEEIVVTANRVPTEAESVGASVTVIGREEIERRHQTTVLDLLRTVPGIMVSQSGGPGTIASVFIRGANSNHTLVLVDGVRVTDTSGGFDFSILRADNIERIEVLRGPQSTLYGSEAIGGVVSITTRQGRTGFHAALDARAGSHATREGRLSLDGGTSRFDYSLVVADRQTDGVSAASEARGNTEEDPYSDLSASARLGVNVLGDGRIDLVLRSVEAEGNLDGFTFGVGPTDDLDYTQERELAVGSLQFAKPLTSWWNLRLHVNASEDEIRAFDPTDVFNSYDIRSRHREVGAQSDFTLGSHILTAGAASERREGENLGSYDRSLDVDSFYLQDQWSWNDRLFLTAGARHDRYSRFGDETTGRVTASYLWPNAWKVHGSYGTGFRGPSFDELFFPFLGNPELRPESSRGADLGVERSFRDGAVVAGLTLFSNRYEDLISFDLNTSTFGNIREAESDGVEASLRVQPRADLEIQSSYTWNETEDRDTGLPLARRPKHRLTLLTAFEPTDRLRGTASLVAVDDRIDSDGTEMDSAERIDVSLEYRLFSWLRPYVLVQNLLDDDTEEVPGYTSWGRAAFLGIRIQSR